MEIGRVIEDFRISQKLSLGEFAKKCDISYSILKNIENGKVKPSNLTINKIATTFNIDYLKEKEIDEIVEAYLSVIKKSILKRDKKYYHTNSNEMVAIYSILEESLYILNNKITTMKEEEKRNVYKLILGISIKINNFV